MIIVLSSLFCTIFALLNINNNKIIKNISIIGIDVSEMTIEEAEQKIKKELDERVNTDLILKHNNQTYTLIPTAIELSYNIKEAVERAYEIGRNGNILKNNFEILKHNKNNTDLKISVNYNENLLKKGFTLGSLRKINWSNILNNTQKTLNVINQAIPVYYQVKPIWSNAKTMFRMVNALNEDKPIDNTSKEIKKETSTGPVFFL